MNLDRVREIMVSTALQETAYDTAVAVDSLIKVNSGVMLQEEIETSPDTDMIGGTEEASDATVLSKRVNFPIAQTKCRPHSLAFIAGFAMGKVVSSAVGLGTLVFKHTFTPVTTHASLPSFTAEHLLKSGLQYKYSGCFVDSFQVQLRRGADRRVSVSGQAYGSGTRVAGTGDVAEFAETPLNGATAAAWLSATTYGGTIGNTLSLTTTDLTLSTAVKADLMDFSWEFRNNVDLDYLYQIGGGLGLAEASRVARSQRVSMTLLFDNMNQVDQCIAQTNMAFQLVVQGDLEDPGGPKAYEGFSLVFPKLRWTATPLGQEGGRLVVACEGIPLQDATYGSVLLAVFTKKAAYMA